MKTKVTGACVLLLLFAALSCYGQQISREIAYTGFLTDSTGQALNGTHTISFALYQVESGGASVWSEVLTVQIRDGEFSARLGSGSPLNDTLGVPLALAGSTGSG